MREIIIILAFLAFVVYAINGRSRRWFAHLSGWQKLFGLIAVLMAVLILMNPDFLALGLLGDTTFFDVLVMALSLQMLLFVQWAWRSVSTSFIKSMRWIRIPSPRLRRLLAIWAVAIGSAISAVQKIVHRILS